MINNYLRDNAADKYTQLLGESLEFQQLVGKGEALLECFSMLLEELFFQLYAGENQNSNNVKHQTSYGFSKLVINATLGRENRGRLVSASKDDFFGAALNTLYLGQEIVDRIPVELCRLTNGIWELEKKIYRRELEVKAGRKVEEVLVKLGQFALKMTYAKKVEHLEEAQARSNRLLQEKKSQLEAFFHQKVNEGYFSLMAMEGERKAAKVSNALQGWQGWSDVKWQRANFQERLTMAKKLAQNPKLVRINSRLAGIRKITNNYRSAGQIPQSGWTFGCDLALVDPSELVLLKREPSRLFFLNRYAESNLCQWSHHIPHRGNGIIICLDSSGSMEGVKEEVGKTLTLALAEILLAQARPVKVMMFGGREEPLQVVDFFPGENYLEQAIEVAQSFLKSRSTDYQKPLAEAVKLIQIEPNLWNQLVLITDGICDLAEESRRQFSHWKEQLGFRVNGVLVNCGHSSIECMNNFCDAVLLSSDFLGHDILEELVSGLNRR